MQAFQLEHNELKLTEDFQRVVDAINTILCMDSEIEAAVVTAAHQKLDQAVRQVNERLKSCDSLLQKGLRAEALQQAQIEPKLLDTVAILDFDEMDLWNNYAQQCGLPRVPELLVDITDDLQTAWADEEPLTDLRYRHRLHALARSPLPIRIEILRQLARVDQSNPLWADELAIYEKSRLADVYEECKAAAANEDLERITALEQELRSSEWRVPPKKELTKFVVQKAQEIRAKQARVQLKQLEPLLNQAYSQSDVKTARELRQRFECYLSEARPSEDDPLVVKVAEALGWLKEKDRQDREQQAFEAALLDLDRALDRPDATKADLEPLYNKIVQFGRGIPEHLQDRLTLRVQELDREAARRRMVKIASIAVATLVVLILIGVGVFLYVRNAELTRHVANLQGMITDEQLDKAEAYAGDLEDNNPRVYEHQDFQALVRQLEQAVQADEDRRTQLEYLLGVANETLAGLSADNPASLDLNRLNKGYDALNEANTNIVKTELERARVTELGDELKRKEKEVQAAVDGQYQREVDQFNVKLKALDPDASGYTGTLIAYKSEAQSLRDRKWISEGFGPRLVDPILAEIDNLIKQDELARAEAAYLSDIRKAVGDSNTFRLKLQSYVDDEEFNGSPRQRDFQQVLKNETALWVGFEEWAALRSKLRGTNLVTYNPKYAPQLLTQITTVLKQHKGFPDEAELQKIADYLNVLVLRDQGTLLRGLEKNVFNQTIVSGLYLLETKDGKKYYSTKIPSPLGNTHYTIRYALDIALDDEKPLTVKREDIANPLLKGGQSFDFDSPQMKFSKLAKDKIDSLSSDATTWESDFLELQTELRAVKGMDEFVKFKLLSAIETVASAGSLYLKEQLQDDLNTLSKFEGEVNPNANWINPDDDGGKKVRQDAMDVLRKLKDPSNAVKGLEEYLSTMRRVSFTNDYEWIGWLHQDRKNQWTVSFDRAQPIDQSAVKLHVLTRSGISGPVTFNEIGDLRNGQVNITVPDVSPHLVQGRPIYKLK